MPFFIRGKAKKRKSNVKTISDSKSKKSKEFDLKKKKSLDEEISSDSDFEENDVQSAASESEQELEETAQEKRLRLAKEYLAEIRAEAADKSDEEDVKQSVAGKLKRDILEKSGKLWQEVASNITVPDVADIILMKGHRLSLTCLVISSDDKYAFSASKDSSIIKWDLKTFRKCKCVHGKNKKSDNPSVAHTSHILSLAISSDGRYLVSGDATSLIHVWNPDDLSFIHTFKGHRAAVSGLVFRKNSHQLFSASHDRTVKVWNLDEMAYVETLFGHMDMITAIDSLNRERSISAGGKDGSVRIWKIIEESQLVFHGHSGAIDCLSLINEEHFVTGADDNSIALWGTYKKKPLTLVSGAHNGKFSTQNIDDNIGSHQNASENWISSVASHQYSDLIASGSKDGSIRFWKCSKDFKSLTPISSLPVVGFVNAIKFSSDGSFLIAAIGQEHRLGRWWHIKEAKNCVAFIKLKQNLEN